MRKINNNNINLSPTTKKVLLILASGVTLSFTRSSAGYFKVLRGTINAWKKINEQALKDKIRNLYKSKIVRFIEKENGEVEITLSEIGKIKVLAYRVEDMKIPVPQKWDGKWRMVIFDIPEKIKLSRDALRWRLKRLGLRELQKSVFVYPYECEDEIDFIIEFYNVRSYVRYGVLETIDNELHLKKIFKLV